MSEQRNVGEWWRIQEGSKAKWKVQLPRGIATLERKKDAIELSESIKLLFKGRCV